MGVGQFHRWLGASGTTDTLRLLKSWSNTKFRRSPRNRGVPRQAWSGKITSQRSVAANSDESSCEKSLPLPSRVLRTERQNTALEAASFNDSSSTGDRGSHSDIAINIFALYKKPTQIEPSFSCLYLGLNSPQIYSGSNIY